MNTSAEDHNHMCIKLKTGQLDKSYSHVDVGVSK